MIASERTKSLIGATRIGIWAIGCRNENYVSFVPLNVFKILNEERLVRLRILIAKHLIKPGILLLETLDFLEDQISLRSVESRDPDRAISPLDDVVTYSLGNYASLRWVSAGLILCAFNEAAANSKFCTLSIGGWEDNEINLIELRIGECD